MPPLNIKTYYEDVASVEAEGKELQLAVTLPPLPSEHAPALERLIGWGKERKELSDLMRCAEASSENADGAMQAVTRLFPVKNKTRRVRLPQDLIDHYGGGNGRHLKFGVQDIHSDGQWQALERQVESMRKYFPQVALYALIDEKTGKKTALVMGIETDAYNSLSQAERKKEQLNVAVRQACKELEVPEAWVDRKIEQTGNSNARPQAKAPPVPRKASQKR